MSYHSMVLTNNYEFTNVSTQVKGLHSMTEIHKTAKLRNVLFITKRIGKYHFKKCTLVY